MYIFKKLTILVIAITTVGLGLGLAPAQAANGLCPSGSSLFGTVDRVEGKTLLVKTTGTHGFERITIAGATVHSNNLTLHPGVFVGAYGCFTDDYKSFKASQITLSYDASTYPETRRDIETLTGVVRSVSDGRFMTETGKPHGFVEILTSETAGVKPNARIQAVGSFNPNGTFSASRVENLSEPPPPVAHRGLCPSGTSLFGTVREIHGKTLLVKTIGSHGFENITTDDAIVHANNLTLHPGVFVGAFGCYTAGFDSFKASVITLSYDAGTYPNERHTETIAGRVHSLDEGKLLVETGMPHGYVNVLGAATAGAKVGSYIEVTGSFNPDGTFAATRVELKP